jgi:hypothetical protein
MRALVCGGRDFAKREWIEEILSREQPSVIIEGGARGADQMAREWGWRHGIPVLTFVADWETYGRAAGPIRNQRMIDQGEPDVVIAFPGGRGTADMIERALRAGIKVHTVLEISANG